MSLHKHDPYPEDKMGIKDPTPASELDVNGDVRADSFTEFSPMFTGSALDVISNIKPKIGTADLDGWAEVDHSTLPVGVRKIVKDTRYRHKISGEIIKAWNLPYNHDEDGERTDRDKSDYDEITVDTECRDLGKQVQVLVKAVQELKAENDDLRSRIVVLESA